jgi:signal peptidase
MKKILKTINFVISLFLILTAAAIAYIAIPIFGNQALIVRSGSMMPTIDIGSIVVTRNTPNYNPGDVIAFRTEKNSKTIVTHRIAKIETGVDGTFYQTKGDANKTIDGWSVDKENVLGKVYFTLPYVGQLLAFAKSKLGLSVLIVLPAIVVILLEVVSIIKEIRKKSHHVIASEGTHRLVHPEAKQSHEEHNNSKLNIFGLKVIIPVLIAIAVSVPVTFAFLSDTETSTDNIIQAAASFTTPTPTITPTVTPTNTPSPTPTPTETPTPSIEPIQTDG